MSETKFTKGPWSYNTKRCALAGEGDKPVRFYGEGMTMVMSDPSEEERANWTLATAAPELYEALEECLYEIRDSRPIKKRAIAALAKARGEA